jgi:hypothetical protein
MYRTERESNPKMRVKPTKTLFLFFWKFYVEWQTNNNTKNSLSSSFKFQDVSNA